jgi:hypothetical protein
VVDGDYALLAIGMKDSQTAAEAAAAATKQGSLAKAGTFRSAVGTLPPDQALLGWADLAQANALSAKLGGEFTEELQSGWAEKQNRANEPLPDVKGVLVLGAQAVDNGVELRGRLTGAMACRRRWNRRPRTSCRPSATCPPTPPPRAS